MPGIPTAEQRAAQSERMKALWKDPAFVDKQIERMVQRWDQPAYRRRKITAIATGQCHMPLSTAPRIAPCSARAEVAGFGAVECLRQDQHAYHVASVGALEDWSLRFVGWRS